VANEVATKFMVFGLVRARALSDWAENFFGFLVSKEEKKIGGKIIATLACPIG
jgi:hypothetical protein